MCGLITERGERARRVSYQRPWERDQAVWRAVLSSIEDATKGVQPAAPCARPPAWLAALVRERLQTLATRWSHDSAFGSIRTLERLGLVQLEPDETYVLAAVGGIGDRFSATRAATLRGDPDLIERVVWRMFEVEGGGEVSLANVDKFSADHAGWRAAFIELTADGTLPREQILTSCLRALNRDLGAYRAGWYARLYDGLEPTVEEITRHQVELRALLRSTVTATVTFAVNKLRLLDKNGLLDREAILPTLGAAVLAAPKGTAMAAVRLAGAIANGIPELRGLAAEVAATALEHPHADVQQEAATLLTALGAADRLVTAADLLEPSVRTVVLGRSPGPIVDAPARSPAPAPRPVPTLPDDDLVDRLAALLEDAGDPLELELVLAGLAGMGDPSRLRPLTKRATAILQRGPREGVTQAWLRGSLARLVLAAGHLDQPPVPPAPSPSVAFLMKRLALIEDVLSGRQPTRSLLATPDDSSGWLGPATLVDRLERSREPDAYDLVAALLRIHPDGRHDALRRTARLGGLVGDVVHYALGGPAPKLPRRFAGLKAKISQPSWWIAASRARMPMGADEWLAANGFDGAGRSEPIEAHVEFRSEPFTWTDRRGAHQSVYWEWDVAVAAPVRHPDVQEPTAVRGGSRHDLAGADLEDLVGWLALIYPHDCEHFVVPTIGAVIDVAIATEVRHDAVRVLDSVARHPGRLGRLTLTGLAAGLSATKADQRAHAVDAVLQHHGAGRLTADQLAEGLIAIQGPATLPRLALTMRDIAASDRNAANFVIDGLTAALPSFHAGARGIHALLELLREELLRIGRPTPQPVRPWLERFMGSSRASRTAASLLSLT